MTNRLIGSVLMALGGVLAGYVLGATTQPAITWPHVVMLDCAAVILTVCGGLLNPYPVKK